MVKCMCRFCLPCCVSFLSCIDASECLVTLCWLRCYFIRFCGFVCLLAFVFVIFVFVVVSCFVVFCLLVWLLVC